MSDVKVSKKFREDFRKVTEYYQCSTEEQELMKEAVRKDYAAAQECYAAMVAEFAVLMIEIDDGEMNPCSACANLVKGQCTKSVEIGASRIYHPVADIPRRCRSYKPRSAGEVVI